MHGEAGILLWTVCYFFVVLVLSAYGLHRYLIIDLYFKNRHRKPAIPARFDNLPVVTVQLPVYNEIHVIERLLKAIGEIEYPIEKLEIQVLDDSTDETYQLSQREVAKLRARGFDAVVLRRENRVGFKAGALDYGFQKARGEFFFILDADFLPPPNILKECINYFADPKVGMIQTRWGHINRTYSWLTRAQAILLDGHLVLEQTARSRTGRFFNFNGTAGLWRKSCIREAGGWQHDTLTEDLDLSYRAQLRGWKFVFVPHVIAPAEVPVEMNAFKSQQHRWAKGSIQTCRKLLPTILRSKLPLGVKAEAFFHLTANFNYILMCALSVLMFPAMVIRYNMGWYEMLLIDVPLFFAATFSFCNFYVVCQREIHKDWRARVKYVPFLMSVGIGLSTNNTRAVVEALLHKDSEFARTPKYRIEADGDEWVGKKYRQSVAVQPLVELLLGLYFTWTVFYALANGIYGSLPFLVLFQVGFLYTGLVSVVQQYAGEPVVLKTQVASGK